MKNRVCALYRVSTDKQVDHGIVEAARFVMVCMVYMVFSCAMIQHGLALLGPFPRGLKKHEKHVKYDF